MGKAPRGFTPARDAEDAFMRLLDSVARFLLYAGALATVVSVGFLVYTYLVTGASSSVSPEQARANIQMFAQILVPGVLALGVGASIIFWGEEVLSVLLLMGAAALYFAPAYLPMVVTQNSTPMGMAVLAALQRGGGMLGIIAVFVLLVDVFIRVRQRAEQGSKADQLKYGKGIKEERDIQNVFMGKCWQLPFCRKFVREKCPIYLTRRTCWKEQVGCMCEEKVIANAMSGQVFSKDALMSTAIIPRNNRLSKQAKFERCRTCVIYNEHQKHKYKLAVPGVLITLGLVYVLGRGQMTEWLSGFITTADRVVGAATFRSPGTSSLDTVNTQTFGAFKEIVLICLMLILMAYLLKLVEYLLFKLKI